MPSRPPSRRASGGPRRIGPGLLRPTGHVVIIATMLALAGCGGDNPSTLSPAGPKAQQTAGLWWLMFGIATAVCVIVIGLLLVAAFGRRGENTKIRPGGTRFVVIAGVAIPAVILTLVYAVGLGDMKGLEQPSRAATTVDVIGHQWWWEVRYPDSGVVTANEIHVPVGQVVHLRLRTADVNHSFWVPRLTPKTDLIAGRINDTWLTADRTGVFQGECAEYCGVQHGHMDFQVVAQPMAAYRSWLNAQASAAPGIAAGSTDALVRRGRQVIETASCASCHTVRGTSADGVAGPDLTHLGDREWIGAGTLPNTKGNLSGWIANPQSSKPGTKMPAQPLSPEDLRAVVAFLEAGGER